MQAMHAKYGSARASFESSYSRRTDRRLSRRPITRDFCRDETNLGPLLGFSADDKLRVFRVRKRVRQPSLRFWAFPPRQ
jgi:hypothetical protein